MKELKYVNLADKFRKKSLKTKVFNALKDSIIVASVCFGKMFINSRKTDKKVNIFKQ